MIVSCLVLKKLYLGVWVNVVVEMRIPLDYPERDVELLPSSMRSVKWP